MVRFVHSSDWHLGKPFGRHGESLRGRLAEARHGIVARVAEAARGAGASLVLVAGDVFDAEAPPDAVLAQALDALAAEADILWAMLPGNHDPARPGGLWERVAARAPANLLLLLEERPVEAAPRLWLLPAPCVSKDPGRDLTAWMDAGETPPGAVRVGVAHGSIREFGEAAHSAAIDPGRPAGAALDYLALGDWHSALRIGPRAWYSGTPEPDRFGLGESGRALAVSIAGPGAEPEVAARATGRFAWLERTLSVLPGTEPREALPACLPEGVPARDVLLSLCLEGRASLAERAGWEAAAAELGPRLAHLALDAEALETAHEPDDLDRIDRAGALREAAEALAAEADDPALAPEARRAARDALGLLYSWAVEETGGEAGA
jgi:hypothetical protein